MWVQIPREAVTVKPDCHVREVRIPARAAAIPAALYKEPRHPVKVESVRYGQCKPLLSFVAPVLSFSLCNFRKRKERFFMSKTKKRIIAVIVLLVLIAAAALAYLHFSPKAQAGDKTLSILVIHSDCEQNMLTVQTGAETLRDALEPEGIIAGDESEYGLFVKTVDGETVDDSQQQWWCITKGGEQLMTGVDNTMIADGEQYEFTLTTGW